ncbi:hypothetical protein GH733_014877, partial [Mirounga leonina]
MGDGYRNSPNLYHSARDIAREATWQSRNQGMDDYKYQDNYEGYAPNDGYYRGNESNPEEDAQSDVTEGHDEEDEIYEGEYQGIPHPDDVKAKQAKMAPSRADGLRGQADLMAERMEDEEQLAHQYETIIDECGHGRFQWILFFVLGLALMADGVEVFVVSFVLPSAEKDMCLSSSKKGMLGQIGNVSNDFTPLGLSTTSVSGNLINRAAAWKCIWVVDDGKVSRDQHFHTLFHLTFMVTMAVRGVSPHLYLSGNMESYILGYIEIAGAEILTQ